jgi:hypothetical protein
LSQEQLGARDSVFGVFLMDERVIKQGWVSLACVPQPPSALPNLSRMPLCCCASALSLARATWWGYRMGSWLLAQNITCPEVAACSSSSIPALAPSAWSFFLRIWRFCLCDWVIGLSRGSLSSVLSAQFRPAEPPGALVELAVVVVGGVSCHS